MLNCTRCFLDFPDDDFPVNRKAQNRRGRGYWCRGCNAQHYRENRERQIRSNRKGKIRRAYGISVDEYDALIEQGCSGCGNKARSRIVLDHCHATNSIRAPLCDNCNKALGHTYDDPEILRNLADYLERHAAA